MKILPWKCIFLLKVLIFTIIIQLVLKNFLIKEEIVHLNLFEIWIENFLFKFMRYYYNLLCIHFNSFLKFIKLFWEFLVNMFDTLRIAWNDNVELILLTYWTLEYRIFVKPWTIFRFLRVWIGWCLGIIPFFYFCYLSFILVLFFYLSPARLVFSLT